MKPWMIVGCIMILIGVAYLVFGTKKRRRQDIAFGIALIVGGVWMMF